MARSWVSVFVKPANLGSSVGISKATSEEELAGDRAALRLRSQDRDRGGVPDAREIECAVLGNDEPEASLPGEIVVTSSRRLLLVRGEVSRSRTVQHRGFPPTCRPVTERVRRLSVEAFRALDLAGMARVDFFLDGRDGALYLNEVNTLPGFTAISMYPKMWEATGLSYADLLTRLLTLAIERHEQKQQLRYVENVRALSYGANAAVEQPLVQSSRRARPSAIRP